MSRIPGVFASIFLLVAGLAACGGGSVSSGGGGGVGSKASSSLVVEMGGDRRVATLHWKAKTERSLASVIADLLVRNAIAQTGNVAIFVDGDQVAVTDEGGSAVIPLAAGTYEVCILDPAVPASCTTVTLAPDSVVVVSGVNIDEAGAVTFGAITTEAAEDNLVAFEDPNNSNKTVVCHQTGAGQFSISVGTPSVLEGHLGHGDTLGACPEDADEDGNVRIGDPPDKVPGSSNGNGGRPANAGRPGNAGNNGRGNDDA